MFFTQYSSTMEIQSKDELIEQISLAVEQVVPLIKHTVII
jgi:hypothetical protein